MGALELHRIQEIEFRLSGLRARHRSTEQEWKRLCTERKNLEAEIKDLLIEKDTLSQGQMMFHVELSG